MNYLKSIKFIESLQVKFKKFNTLKTKKLLKLAGIKLNSIIIHVAGSNGKGSVCAMLESILLQQGYSVALNTSPHLIDYTERFRVNGKNISEKEFVEALEGLMPAINLFKKKPSSFEVLTVMAAKIFAEKKPNFIIFETGMGGRLDATNAFKTQIQVITDISLEHTASLGNTINKIASEKAGIIKEKSFVIVRKDNAGYKVIKKKIKEKKAVELNPKKEFEKMKSNLLGLHQKRNVSLAVTAINAVKKLGFKVTEKSIEKGLMKVQWNARMQVIQKNPLMIVDGAHNPEGIKALMNSVQELNKEKKFSKIIAVFGVLKDKNFKEMISLLKADELILTKVITHRALEPKKLIKSAKKNKGIKKIKLITSIPYALNYAKKIAGKNDLILVFGSLYLAGSILKLIKKH
ncbi:MAG: hypothetical protein JW703_00935 [Candidatus Diapherotrites archaeon]|nr:hypothetical protein [Candidatus Diapherotrites archaeon]